MRKRELGTAPVFLTSISTILGAILFLRFGYSVSNVGLHGTIAIIFLGHLVTIPTAMAVAEIATNQRLEGGGAYYLISRSFGITIGAAIGIALYLSEAISVSFYCIAFAEAFRPVFAFLNETYQYSLSDPRIVSVPILLLLGFAVLAKGASFGVKALYVVVGMLFLSLALFFLGSSGYTSPEGVALGSRTVASPDPFFLVFAIVFPAFTGITAGLGLSGDLKNPKKSIPLGTLIAAATGITIYLLVALKLVMSASPEDLAADQLIMSRIALWGPIIPIGLACATFSSALGSTLVAPRTLQALGSDNIFPGSPLNKWIATGRGKTKEPFNGTLLTLALALFFVVIGSVDFVARIISMVFMVTYGAICLISVLEHFAADPSYRPSFRSKWYISLLGALACLWLMFKMSPIYAAFSILIMALIYMTVAQVKAEERMLASLFRGAIFQISRKLRVFLQKAHASAQATWRPSVVCISADSFHRLEAFNLLRWISYRYGFGTYIHYIEGEFTRTASEEAKEVLARLVKLAGTSESNVYVDTIINTSWKAAVSQLLQLPGISGKENNLVLFEYARGNIQKEEGILDNYRLAVAADFDICILASSERGWGYEREMHIWITPGDYENANLMILLGYIIIGHPDWHNGFIRIFSLVPEEELEDQKENLLKMISEGRLPISPGHIETIAMSRNADRKKHVNEHSRDADLIIMGFSGDHLRRHKGNLFTGYDEVGNILFVNTMKEIEIDRVEDEIVDEKETKKNGEKGKPPEGDRGKPKSRGKPRKRKGEEE